MRPRFRLTMARTLDDDGHPILWPTPAGDIPAGTPVAYVQPSCAPIRKGGRSVRAVIVRLGGWDYVTGAEWLEGWPGGRDRTEPTGHGPGEEAWPCGRG